MSYFENSGDTLSNKSSGVPGLPKVFCIDGKLQINHLDRIFTKAIENHKKNEVFIKGLNGPYAERPFAKNKTITEDGHKNKLEIAQEFEKFMKESVKSKKANLKRELEKKNQISCDDTFYFNLLKNTYREKSTCIESHQKNKNLSLSMGLSPSEVNKTNVLKTEEKVPKINDTLTQSKSSSLETLNSEAYLNKSKSIQSTPPTKNIKLSEYARIYNNIENKTGENTSKTLAPLETHLTSMPNSVREGTLVQQPPQDFMASEHIKDKHGVFSNLNSKSRFQESEIHGASFTTCPNEKPLSPPLSKPIFNHTNSASEQVKISVKKDFDEFSSEKPILTVVSPFPLKQHRITSFSSEKHINIKENQRGITFDSLFASYIQGASFITVTDPYVRFFYQIRNLMEFIETVLKNRMDGQDVSVHLITIEDPTKNDKQKESLEKIKESCKNEGLYFSYEFDESQTIHARHIITNTGWKILLDRGLDIFQHYEMKDAFHVANRLQKFRYCKAFEVTYIQAGIS